MTYLREKPAAARRASCSHPQLHLTLQLRRELAVEQLPHLVRVVPGAEVRRDDQFVLEPRGAFHEVVQVHVAELVNLVAAVARPDEAQLRDEDLRVEAGRAVVESRGRRVRSEEHTSELQSLRHLVCRLLLEKKKKK